MLNTNSFLFILFAIIGIIVATTIHEFTRAITSTLLGDTLPKQKGRVTLNPIKHFEPIGFILMLATGGFGWGKPVDTTSLYYKNRKRDTLITAIAPDIANVLVAYICFLIGNVFLKTGNIIIYSLFMRIGIYNISLAIYNIVPVSPMDGLKVLAHIIPSNKYFQYLQYEKVVQAVFMIFLFMGTTDFIFTPIINFVITILSFLAGL